MRIGHGHFGIPYILCQLGGGGGGGVIIMLVARLDKLKKYKPLQVVGVGLDRPC
jgi:hypothetical protein